MRRILFLDIDGVLNSRRWWHQVEKERVAAGDNVGIVAPGPDRDLEYFDPEAVARLERICKETGAHVVISSSWRKSHTLPQLVALLRERGFTGKVVGVTPTLGVGISDLRGREILKWLGMRRAKGLLNFVVLDDYRLHEVERRQVWTDPVDGLTDRDADRAIRMLKEDGQES